MGIFECRASVLHQLVSLIPDGTNQNGFLDLSVAGNKRQAGDSGLGDDQTVIGIPDGCKCCRFEKQVGIVNAQIEIFGLSY